MAKVGRAMPVKQSKGPDLVAEVSALLGQQVGASRSQLTAEALKKLTQKQLIEAARMLGLPAGSRLKKDALVTLVWEAWQNLGEAGDDPSAEPRDLPLFHKFEVGQSGPPKLDESRDTKAAASTRAPSEMSNEIPWGYGHDRIAAMPVDPDRLYAYWEVLEQSITKARGQLGRGGAGAWLNLRVYDTTGRIFDGTNAHGTIDHRVERGDRQWFVSIGRPASDVIIEIGMKSDEGYFVKIARSGRIEFPRREPVGWSDPEWLTVRVATGQVERGAFRGSSRIGGAQGGMAAPRSSAGAATGGDPGTDGLHAATPAALPPPHHVPAWAVRRVPWEDALRFADASGESHLEWQEVHVDGTIEPHRQFHWVGPATITSWEAGPFPYPVEVPEPLRETFAGKTRVFRFGGRTHVVYGPWHVVIRGLGARQSRTVLSRWEVYRSWAEVGGHEVRVFETTSGMEGGASERIPRMVGASDRRWVGSSEIRFGGSSELYFLAGSELRLRGASERLFAGASELRLGGSSERLLGGSSELLLRGSSERQYLGASEARLGGSSESVVRGSGASRESIMGAGDNAYPPPPRAGHQPGSASGVDPSSRSRRG